MRLSELLELEVRDRDGTRVGSVADVVLVQDGPMRGPYQASLRVAGRLGRGGAPARAAHGLRA